MQNLKTLFSLSEIIFNKSSDQRLDDKVDIINQSITEIGFKNTANIYSVSSTAKLGGNIGWIQENQLSEQIKKIIINLDKVFFLTNSIDSPCSIEVFA